MMSATCNKQEAFRQKWSLSCALLLRRMTLLRGDNVWEQYLDQTERFLNMRQYAVAVIAMMETSLQLQNLYPPWLALLRRSATDV